MPNIMGQEQNIVTLYIMGRMYKLVTCIYKHVIGFKRHICFSNVI
jgi:hypothetical protein